MKSTGSAACWALLCLLCAKLATAWPWPSWTADVGVVVARQNGGNGDSSSSGSSSAASASSGSSRTASASATATSGNDDQDDTPTSSSNRTTPAKTSFDARLPAGGIAMQTPAILAGPQYYKIGIDPITFGWNYTSLLADPTAIDVYATCTQNSQLYTIAANQSFSKETGSVVWDTRAYQDENKGNPLLTQMYTLIVKDSDAALTATAQAGYLASYAQYAFGMYIPQPPTPLSEFQCASCNSAAGLSDAQAFRMVLAVGALTVASFTWFVCGAGVVY